MNNPGTGELASDLGISARTLVRRLADAGASFSNIKEDLRKSHAAWYLQHTELSIEAIASHLGYTDPENFGRKFKHWYRMAPSKMRKALRTELHANPGLS
jgi:AraC-like DNA-binding protein